MKTLKERAQARLESLSNKVRYGEPISFLEAIAVINYQTQLKAERDARRENSFFGRLKRLFSKREILGESKK